MFSMREFAGPPSLAPVVLIGGQVCSVSTSNQTCITCVLSPGRYLTNQIIIFQELGRMLVQDVAQFSVSFAQCPPGQQFQDFLCIGCVLGTFSSTYEASACALCPVGYIGVTANASSCQACQGGFYWIDQVQFSQHSFL
jgi:hypothetical protein